MSFAIHIFISEKFEKKSYLAFLDDARLLFGECKITGSNPACDSRYSRIDDCFIRSEPLPSGEFVRVNITASERHESVKWGFEDYEWYLSFETNAGRSATSLAVQLGSLLLATRRFKWTVVVDRDSYVDESYPVEFRSQEALLEHIKRVFGAEHLALLQQND